MHPRLVQMDGFEGRLMLGAQDRELVFGRGDLGVCAFQIGIELP